MKSFENITPDFDNGTTKWYINKHFQNYLENEQADNLPKLKGFGCFNVIAEEVNDLVLIDHKQNILGAYSNTLEGEDQMTAKINIIKISKHYDDCEKVNI